MADVETLEGAGISETEFKGKVDNLQTELLDLCNAEPHNGVVVCSLVNALSCILHDMITANGLDSKEMLDNIRADLQTNLDSINQEFSTPH